MSLIFPKNARRIAAGVGVGIVLLGAVAAAAVWYYATPKWYRVGYMPRQPVAFSHAQHVEQIGLDCRYCHTHVFESPHANIPATSTCMNCHDPAKANIKGDSPALSPVREAFAAGSAIDWVRVHRLPDFVYFNHAAHVNRGVSCYSCHGRVDTMVEVWHAQPLSMAWCLDCHRDPGPNLRPVGQVTNLDWNWRDMDDPAWRGKSRQEFATTLIRDNHIAPPTNCTGCHR